MRWGSHWTLDCNVLALTRSDGLDTRRVSNTVGWTVPTSGAIGDVYRLEASLRGDVYNTEGNPETFSSTGGSNATGRLLPRVTADWSWPLSATAGGWAHEVEPLTSSTWRRPAATHDEIPNEDSRDFEFDETNLFEPNRFPGLDRNEGGGKLAYGRASAASGRGRCR